MKPFSPIRAHRLRQAVLALTFATGTGAAQAQLRVPSLNLPLPAPVGALGNDAVRAAAGRLDALRELPIVRDVRLEQVTRLLRQHRDVLEADPRGAPAVRREILAWSPSPAGLAAASAAGLSVLRETRLDGLDEVMLILRVPDGADTATLLEQLRQRDPQGTYDFNHIYTGSGDAGGAKTAPRPAGATPRTDGGASVGLIDSGVDAGHDVFRKADIRRWGCNDSVHPDAHGTAVAALMVGQSSDFRGVAPQASLYAADVYCASSSGGSAERIAGALAWLAREQVAVINMSIVGPPNQTLERVVGAMVKRGHLLVAAVGNDGPAAPPLYPASYPGVVGVSAVDKRGRVLPEAARGPQVMFAAPGNNMVSAGVGDPAFRQVRGTSFAAPIVAALLAEKLRQPGTVGAAQALAALARQAARSDAASVSNETGLGIVGQDFRTDPERVR
jgi:subtilisin family serine protease